MFLEATDQPVNPVTFKENVLPLRQWSHVVISYESSTSTASLYVNGMYEDMLTIPGFSAATNKSDLFVGVIRLTVSEDFQMAFGGSIACLGLYQHALQEEHLALVMDMCSVGEYGQAKITLIVTVSCFFFKFTVKSINIKNIGSIVILCDFME